MPADLTGKTALVTGSSRGIGRGIALALAAEGCDLMLTGRDEAALADTAKAVRDLGRRAEQHVADLRGTDAVQGLAETVVRAFGALDILVNNAGATKRGDFFALTDADWQDGFALKFFAHMRLARTIWPLLKERRGSVVTIAGIGARVPSADFTIGSSVNAASVAFTKALADIGRRDEVQVNSINPGRVETERLWRHLSQFAAQSNESVETLHEQLRRTSGITRFGQPDDIAALTVFIVSPRGRWLHGATVDMDGGEVRGL
jgi:3-oxoacyl-[acyl-carrier protein] reductase